MHNYQRRIYQISEGTTECLIYFAVLFGPWAFGTTQPWSIDVMNGVGFALGLLWLGKLILRCGSYRPVRWTGFSGASELNRWREAERRFTWMLAGGTFYVLLYCLISAWNARAIYLPGQWRFAYRRVIFWLPHSYDQAGSWSAFWKYLGLAGLFWALRDWLLTLSRKELERFDLEDFARQADSRLPVRLRRLFWA